MIAPPAGWRRNASVGADVFTSPDRRWQVRYRLRVAPLRRVADIVDATLDELPEWRTHAAANRERLVTHEGEHAFGVSLAGRWLDDDARRYVAVIYGDDFYDVLDAIAIGGEPIEPRARAFVYGVSLRLGARRRRYFYARPADWRGHATGLTTHWFPPLFPARPTTIVIYPANPTNEQPRAVLDAMAAHHAAQGAELRELEPPQPITARHDLAGLHWTLVCDQPGAPKIARDLVVFARGAYTYALQLDAFHAPDADARAVFLALARTVEPVPVGPGAEGGAVFSHYV